MKNRAKITAVAVMFVVLAVFALLLSEKSFYKYGVNEDSGIIFSKDGITIPKSKPPQGGESLSSSIGYFVYNERCYVEHSMIKDNGNVLGKHLGKAVEHDEKLTSRNGSVSGDFYAINGYAPEDVLGIKTSVGTIEIYVSNTGIMVKHGSDLLEKRLHISENFAEMQYESRGSLDELKWERYRLNDNEIAKCLIRGLDRARLIPVDSVRLKDEESSIYDTEKYLINLKTTDGIITGVRLFDDGYAVITGRYDICLKIPKLSYMRVIRKLDRKESSEYIGEPEPLVKPTVEDCMNDFELGRFMPRYMPEWAEPEYIAIVRYLDPPTGKETGTKEIYMVYSDTENLGRSYEFMIIRKNELENHWYDGVIIDKDELTVEKLSEYAEETRLGVAYDEAVIAMSIYGIDAETAYKIFTSVQCD